MNQSQTLDEALKANVRGHEDHSLGLGIIDGGQPQCELCGAASVNFPLVDVGDTVARHDSIPFG